ncbi:MAG: tetratricopeptide repeat protein [Gammaproteobacteria bacterium]|nr:tetratricopeptide repeat protein [Gammaproteobacteria bacterium]
MPEDLIRKLEIGYEAQHAGNFAKAEQMYQQVLKADASNKHALNLLGMLCVNTKRPEEAVDYIRKALKVDPRDAQAHANIGLAYKDLGMPMAAARHFDESVKMRPANPMIFNNYGNVLRDIDQPKKAIRAYDQALRLDPEFAECWSNLAAALRDTGDFDAGLKAIDKALELQPDLAQAYSNRGDIRLQQGRFEEAFDDYKKAVDLDPNFTATIVNMGKVLRDMDKPDEALKVLERAFEVDPGNPQTYHVTGVLLEQMGDREAAIENFQQAIEIAPDMAVSHYYLAQIKNRQSSDAELEAALRIWAKEDMTPNARMYTAFTLYRIYEQREDYDTAFSYLAAANKAKSDVRTYDDDDFAKFSGAIVEATEETVARLGSDIGHPDPRPVFVLGMPRSGTSLTEQILASHSDVAGAGELSYAFDTVRRTADFTGEKFPAGMPTMSPEQFAKLGADYMALHSDEHLQSRYVVDKSPLNFQYIGPLALMLSGARFIHCHRDPIANCFAIHRIPFGLNQTYAHTLDGLGQYYTRFWNIMQRWQALFPKRVLNVRYEDTVANVDAQARRILDFLDLPFEESVLDFYKTRRLVKTPSASQVREPIYKDAVAAWKKYEKHLGPLIENLRIESRE